MMIFLEELVSSRGVVANLVNCDIRVHEFELQSRYYFHFRTNNVQKDMKLRTHPQQAMA